MNRRCAWFAVALAGCGIDAPPEPRAHAYTHARMVPDVVELAGAELAAPAGAIVFDDEVRGMDVDLGTGGSLRLGIQPDDAGAAEVVYSSADRLVVRRLRVVVELDAQGADAVTRITGDVDAVLVWAAVVD